MRLCIPGTSAFCRHVVLWILVAILTIPAGFAPASAAAARPGAVFALTNTPSGNAVAVFQRATDGMLTADGEVRTQGFGASGAFGSQGALMLSRGDHRFLFAVNAGSDSVTVFRWDGDQLQLTDVVASGGTRPVSVTIHQDLVYVLNAGDEDNITGFRLSKKGKLTTLDRSTRPLGLTTEEPFQVQFTPNGRQLVISIQGGPVEAGAAAGSRLVTIPLRRDGRPRNPSRIPRLAMIPPALRSPRVATVPSSLSRRPSAGRRHGWNRLLPTRSKGTLTRETTRPSGRSTAGLSATGPVMWPIPVVPRHHHRALCH